MDELAAAQQHQARFQDELKSSRESLDIAACGDLEDASKRTIELKRKADDSHGRTRSHRELRGRATQDHMMAEEALNNGSGCLGDLGKDAASATHSLSCRVPDRDSNDAKFLREALDKPFLPA